MTRKHFVLAMASSPPVPLDEIYKDENHKRCFASLNMTMKILCTLPLVIASKAKQSTVLSVQDGWLPRSLCSLAMTRNSIQKIFIVMLSVSETSLSDSKLLWIPSSFHLYLRFYSWLFSSRGTGGLIAKQPPIPL